MCLLQFQRKSVPNLQSIFIFLQEQLQIKSIIVPWFRVWLLIRQRWIKMATINSTSNSINRNSWSTLISSNSNSNGNGNSIGRLLRRRFLFGFFLLVFFFSCITGNYTALKSITASSSSSCTTVTTTTANTTFSYYDNPYTAEGGSVSQFEQLEFIKLIGKGG